MNEHTCLAFDTATIHERKAMHNEATHRQPFKGHLSSICSESLLEYIGSSLTIPLSKALT